MKEGTKPDKGITPEAREKLQKSWAESFWPRNAKRCRGFVVAREQRYSSLEVDEYSFDYPTPVAPAR